MLLVSFVFLISLAPKSGLTTESDVGHFSTELTTSSLVASEDAALNTAEKETVAASVANDTALDKNDEPSRISKEVTTEVFSTDAGPTEEFTESQQGGFGGGGRGGGGGGFVPLTDHCKLYMFIMAIVVVGPMTLFGLIGNGLSFYALWPQRHTNATAFLLMCLAIFDTMTALSWTYIKGSVAICNYFNIGQYYMSHIVRYTWAYGFPSASIFHMSATWTVVFVTLHRFIAACYPLRATEYATVPVARVQVAVAFAVCLVFNIPRLCERKVVDTPARAITLVRPYALNTVYEYSYLVGLYYLLIFLIPFVALSIMTYKLIRALSIAKAKREEMTKMKREENDITKTLIAVVLIFMICQISNPIRRVLAAVYDTKVKQGCGSPYFYYIEFSNFLTQFNACVNFVIYCIFGKRFRDTLKARLCASNKVVPLGMSTQATKSSRA